jgi:hypothetical protein
MYDFLARFRSESPLFRNKGRPEIAAIASDALEHVRENAADRIPSANLGCVGLVFHVRSEEQN